jgi:regulatory protein
MAGTITAISVQKKNPNRLNVEIECEFAFGVDRLVGAWLHVGQQLTDEQIKEIVARDTAEAAYLAALRFLSYRLRSKKEIVDRLNQKGFTSDQIDQVIARLEEERMVDDQRFAESWAESRKVFRPRSKNWISRELRSKGIPSPQIEKALSEIGSDAQLALSAAQKAHRRWRDESPEDFRQHCTAFLARRGFTYESIREVLPKIWAVIQDENQTD